MTKRKQLKKKYKVAFWKEYSYLLKTMAWVCINEESGEFICEAKTLKEIEEILIKNYHTIQKYYEVYGGCKMYKVKIRMNNGYCYEKTMTEDEVKEFKNDLRYINLIELCGNGNIDVIIFRDAINSIEIKKLEEK